MVSGDREDSSFSAGGGDKLGIIRYGREEMTQHERIAESNIYPGEAVMASTDAEGSATFDHHDGSTDAAVYVAIEARGRGMDAQTDDGYTAGEDYVIAVRASGGGLNLSVATGENVAETDTLTPEADTGKFIVDNTVSGFAEANEAVDLSGASEAGLVEGEVN